MEEYNTKQFEEDIQDLGIELNCKQICQFIKYYELLVKWNSFMNLTAITEFDEVFKKHFIDSLTIVKATDLNRKCKLLDVGTGAGFPGIPIKIVYPDVQITLLDSLQKRILFLDEVIIQLELKGINTIHGRAEDYAKPGKLREKFDLCCSRAVANLSTLSEYCLPFVKTGGVFISYKSEKISEEMQNAKKAIHILGGQVAKQVDMTLPESEIYRNLVVIEKVKNTPSRFPRKAGIAVKEPIH